MKREMIMKVYLLTGLLLMEILFGSPTAYAADKKQAPQKGGEQLMTRIDFGNSYITGQTLKSGAVYLLQRKKSDVKTMLKYREDYRKEILEAHEIRKRDGLDKEIK